MQRRRRMGCGAGGVAQGVGLLLLNGNRQRRRRRRSAGRRDDEVAELPVVSAPFLTTQREVCRPQEECALGMWRAKGRSPAPPADRQIRAHPLRRPPVHATAGDGEDLALCSPGPSVVHRQFDQGATEAVAQGDQRSPQALDVALLRLSSFCVCCRRRTYVAGRRLGLQEDALLL